MIPSGPMKKVAPPALSSEADHYVGQIRRLLAARPCVHSAFTPAEQKLATTLFAENVPLEQVEHAILLGCARKYAASLNGQSIAVVHRSVFTVPSGSLESR